MPEDRGDDCGGLRSLPTGSGVLRCMSVVPGAAAPNRGARWWIVSVYFAAATLRACSAPWFPYSFPCPLWNLGSELRWLAPVVWHIPGPLLRLHLLSLRG